MSTPRPAIWVLRVEHPRPNAQLGQPLGEAFRVGDAAGADEHWLSCGVRGTHGLGCTSIALFTSDEQLVGCVFSDAAAAGRDHTALDIEVLTEALGRF